MSAFIESLNNLDTSLFLTLNGFHNSYFDNFMFLYSEKFIWIPFYLAVVYQIIKISGKNSVWIILSLIIALTLADQISSAVIKPLVQRFRPSQDESLSGLVHIVNDYKGGRFGFVSGHSANSMGFAVLTSLIFRNRIYTILTVFWSILTGYSRIYLGVHYPGDVLGGFLVGIVVAIFCFYILKLIIKENAQLKLRDLSIPVYVLILNILAIFIYGFF